MEAFADEGKVVGVVFDLSLRHMEGKRIIDSLKTSLINVISECLENDVDAFYLYHPDVSESLNNHGDQFSAVGNYETDGWPFDLNYAMKKTLYVLANHGLHFRKYLIYITDRIQDKSHLEKVVRLNEKDMFDVQFIFIGVGDRYNKESFKLFDNCHCLHLDQPTDLVSSLFKENGNGQRETVYCQTHE